MRKRVSTYGTVETFTGSNRYEQSCLRSSIGLDARMERSLWIQKDIRPFVCTDVGAHVDSHMRRGRRHCVIGDVRVDVRSTLRPGGITDGSANVRPDVRTQVHHHVPSDVRHCERR